MSKLLYKDLSDKIIKAAITVHKKLGPGLLESAYEACLVYELMETGLNVKQQVKMPIRYGKITIDCGYRLDLVVEDKIVLELKAVEALTSVHEAQLLTYLKLSGYRVGILINFNELIVSDGIMRRII